MGLSLSSDKLDEIYKCVLRRYRNDFRSILLEGLSYEAGVLSGECEFKQNYLNDSAMCVNNTDMVLLSNQSGYLATYCYCIQNLDKSLEDMQNLHGKLAFYKQEFIFKKTILKCDNQRFKAEIMDFENDRCEVKVSLNDSYECLSKVVFMKTDIHLET